MTKVYSEKNSLYEIRNILSQERPNSILLIRGNDSYENSGAKSFIELGHSVTVIHCYSNSEIIFFNDPNINLIFLPIRKIPFLGFLIYYYSIILLIPMFTTEKSTK